MLLIHEVVVHAKFPVVSLLKLIQQHMEKVIDKMKLVDKMCICNIKTGYNDPFKPLHICLKHEMNQCNSKIHRNLGFSEI